MAHRRRSSGPRRMTSWINGFSETGGPVTTGGNIRELALFVPLEDHEGATVIRIVGNVFLGTITDSSSNAVQVATWGIYLAGSGSVGDFSLSPANSLDRELEHWLHMRFITMNKSINNNTTIGPIRPWTYESTNVDIRVMRKVHEGDGLKIALTNDLSFVSTVNLRILLKHT